MSIRRTFNVFAIILLTMGLTGSSVYAADLTDIDSISVREGYAPGNGEPIGVIRKVSGTVLIIHPDQDYGYRAIQDLNLFQGDTLLTGTDGSAAFKLNDGSFISLSSKTHLVINKSLYAPNQKTRSSFISMLAGKARFVIKKFVDARHSEFKVKTKTSVAGVRGSDFIIDAAETVTEITALENTELEIFSLEEPAALVILHDFEKTRVTMGMRPEEAEKVNAEDVDRLMKEFRFFPPDQSQEPRAFETSAAPDFAVEKIYVPRDELVRPQFNDIRPDLNSMTGFDGVLRNKAILMDEHDIKERNRRISQDRNEDIQKRPLPDFPGSPE